MKYASAGLRDMFLRVKSEIGRNSRERGFSLLEALTALAVLSIIMSSLMDNYSTGLRGADITEKRTEATILARSLLAEATGSSLTIPGRRSGKIRGFSWRIDTVLLERISVGENKKQQPWGLYRMRITVMRGRSVLTSLETVKIGKTRA